MHPVLNRKDCALASRRMFASTILAIPLLVQAPPLPGRLREVARTWKIVGRNDLTGSQGCSPILPSALRSSPASLDTRQPRFATTGAEDRQTRGRPQRSTKTIARRTAPRGPENGEETRSWNSPRKGSKDRTQGFAGAGGSI